MDNRSARWEFKDIGKKYGKLTAVKDLGTFWISGVKRRKIECICDCGNVHVATISHLKLGQVKSCGCLSNGSRVKAIEKCTKHELINHGLYKVWSSIQQRCYNPKHRSYKNYGGRGILMCEQWRENFYSFYQWAVANKWEQGKPIDRINNNGNYEPDNCRFVTIKENNRNKRKNINITFNGVTQCIAAWAADLNVDFKTLKYRLSNNQWSLEEALTTPKNTKYGKFKNRTLR